MFKNWFSQGIATNVVSWVIIAMSGLVVAYIAKVVPLWVAPILYGLTASALSAIIIIGIRFTFRPALRIISPNNARVSVRECLDQAQVTIQNVPLDGWKFYYNITVDGRNMAVGQQRKEPNYLTFSTAITFTPDDNVAIESRQGGVAAVVKALRISLAASKIAYSGIEAPLKRVTIMKHVFIGETFTDYHLMQIVLELEAALTLAMEISEVPPREQAKQVSQ